MNNIVKIPGLALLTLSLTDCVDRNGPDQDPIVGDWHAVKLDADVFPMLLSGDGEETYTLNVELSVKPDLQGTLLLAADVEYDGYIGGYEQGSTLVVDAGGASKYRIDVAHDPFGEQGYADGGYADSGYNPTGYDTTPGTGGYDTDPGTGGYDTDAGTGAVHEQPGSSLPLQVPLTPRLASGAMVLQCTLADEVLNCQRDGDGEPIVWVFERTVED